MWKVIEIIRKLWRCIENCGNCKNCGEVVRPIPSTILLFPSFLIVSAIEKKEMTFVISSSCFPILLYYYFKPLKKFLKIASESI